MLSNVSPKKDLDSKVKKFLSHFSQTLYCYIPDNNPNLPVVHSEILNLERQVDGYGIFFSVNGFYGGKRDAAHLTSLNALFCDIDYPDKINKSPEKIQSYKNELIMELMDDDLLPTAIVETKNGLHVYWIFNQPIVLASFNAEQRKTILENYRKVEEAIIARFDGDPAAKDVSRVLRIPGTLHQKNINDPFTIKLLSYSEENLYMFDALASKFLKQEPEDMWALANSESSIDSETRKKIEIDFPKLERPSYKKLLDNTTEIPEGMRNRALLVAASACCLSGWPIEKTFSHFLEFHGLGLREIRKTISSAYRTPYDFGTKNEVMQHFMDEKEHQKVSEVASKVVADKYKEVRKKENDEQKELFQEYEQIIANRYPHLKYKQRADFFLYSNGVYRVLHDEDFQSIIMREMSKDSLFNYRKISSVKDKIACFKSLESRTFTHAEENPNPNIVNLKNGLLDIEKYTVIDHTPDYLSTVQIPISYEPTARAPQWFKFLNDIMDGDQDQILLLKQIAGYCLTNDVSFQKAFIFLGRSGGNGKGTFTRTLSKIVGKENTTNLKLTDITGKYGLTGLIGKRLNIVDEIAGNYFESDVIKSLISGDPMTAIVKYKVEPVDFNPIAKIILTLNELPKINDTSQALYRRFIIVNFNKTFQGELLDKNLEVKLEAELSGILNWAIQGLKSLHEMGHFNETAKNSEALNAFKQENSPLVEFLINNYEPVNNEDYGKYSVNAQTIYLHYRGYCIDSGYKPKAIGNFNREILNVQIEGWRISKQLSGRFTSLFGLRPVASLSGDKIKYD